MNFVIIGGSKSGKSEIGEKISLTLLNRESKSMILSESFKQTSPIYDLMMVDYSVSAQRTNVSRVSLSREPKSMIWCKSLTQRTNVSRVSLKNVIYIATMKPYDKEDKERIKKHIKNREGLNFVTIEVEKNLHEIVNSISGEDTILIDSITSLLINEMFINNEIIKKPSVNILNGLKQIILKAENTIIVSDYIFNDAIEYDEITKNFQKELAIINSELVELCDNVIECNFGNVKYHKCKGETFI